MTENHALPSFEPWNAQLGGLTVIEASAGTGKTWNITEIFLRLLLDQACDVREILVVTFTEAATTELRDRIRRGIRGRLAAGLAHDETALSEDGRLALRAALASFDEASIFTIHGFCQRVLQQFAFECGAPAELTLMKDEVPLRAEVSQDFYTRATHALSLPVFTALTQGGFTPAAVNDLAKKLSEGPLAGLPARPSASFEALGRNLEAAITHLRSQWEADGPAARELLRQAAAARQLDNRTYRAGRVEELFDTLVAFLITGESAPKLDMALRLLGRSGFEQHLKKKGGPPPTHPFFDAVDALRAAFEGMEDGVLGLMHDALQWMPAEFARRKAAQQAVSFGDLLSGVATALADPVLGARLGTAVGARYRWALIDEFQDTDPIQWSIFHRLFQRLFLIGDPKQAIYGFRGADLPTYLAARELAAQRFGLARNFRSDGPLVAAINRLFHRTGLARPFVDERIAYAPVEAKHGAPRLRRCADAAPAEPLVFRTLPREGARLDRTTSQSISATFAREALPEQVAADVVTLLNGGWELEVAAEPIGTTRWRPLQPRDVAVLVRTHVESSAMKSALTRVGVPAVLRGTGSVFATPEAEALRQIVECLADPTRLPLVRVALATELLGVSAEEIVGLTATGAERLPDAPENAALTLWTSRFRRWHLEWSQRGFMVAFRALLSECGVLERTLRQPGGDRSATNLLHVAELLHGAERAQALRPHALLAWFDRELQLGNESASGTRDEERQLRLESDADALQIVTMHGSKGLEYGVVFLPFLWGGGGLHPSEKDHPRQPLVPPVGAPPTAPRHAIYLCGDEATKSAVTEAAIAAVRAENLRLLYVALTRAQHQSIVYWGPVARAGVSPLAYVLHPAPPGAPDPLGAVEASFPLLSEEAIAADLAALGTVWPLDWEAPGRVRFTPQNAEQVPLRLRTFPAERTLDLSWRRASFTGLTRGAGHARSTSGREFDEVDENDARAGAQAPQGLHAAPQMTLFDALATEPTTLSTLPAGRGTGLCLHRVLENVDFVDDDPAALTAEIGPALRAYGLDPRWSERICRGLADVLNTPLAPGDPRFTLRAVPRVRRLSELRFDLAVARAAGGHTVPIDAARIARALGRRKELAAYATQLASLNFSAFTGFLGGSLDLVFEYRGRYWLADYKSNRLGETYGHYGPERLAEVMAESHYHLQAHLYALALHRYLRQRLGAGYAPEKHFGGCLYLFVRGMHPGLGAPTGVFSDRPPIAVLDALAAALGVP